jgi:archaellum component FlaC
MASSEAEMLTKMTALVMDQMELRLSARQVAELSKQLREANEQVAQSEKRFRGLFDEAPIAYVRQDTDAHI